MPRRVSLPAADELFRSTGGSPVQPSTPQQHTGGDTSAASRLPAPAGEQGAAGEHAPAEDGDGPERTAAGAAGAPEAGDHGGREPRQTPVPGQNAGRGGRETAEARRGAGQPPAQSAAGAARGQGRGRTAVGAAAPRRGRPAARRPSGRERHDEKITVYVSAEELMDLEHARLVLRGEHGLAVDRGRIVREAVAVVLADLEARGDASILVRRLRGR
ncbi:hypothetical protein SAMN05216481_11821 [Streptomyces radiopugnans]|uniref:Uncharacterized protein n=1 Tax=Streptomyces radiopugnans TaxID=403935 RepID=A0A1H9JJC0_9ACTN|nr:hypothetical protein SAMN05216481_11821 [Streptomyces radiopugnans]